ncbi:MAG TPA: RimK-like ATPgrasp N-terminal domain-containing protein, partial [Usitatibacter sp.]|nr:RimK-like ATPgrasp N-terminal domain-containing protein [Usitatibacter sp.]
MKTVIVTDQQQQWPFEIPDAAVVTARQYLAEPESGPEADVRVLNLCRTGRYQGRGYYVSLLAEARGQAPLPDVKTVEELKSEAYQRALAAKLESLVQETLRHDESDRFELDAYLGKDPAQRHQALAGQLFENVRAPLLRALFARTGGRWRLDAVQAIGIADVPSQH